MGRKGVHYRDTKKIYGQHYTPTDLFNRFISPYVKERLYEYLWVDLFAGNGNLILPIIRLVPEDRRVEFFAQHVYMQEVDVAVLEQLKFTLEKEFGLPRPLIDERVVLADSFREYPKHLGSSPYPVFHITNPPYLYLGHIRKNKEFSVHLDLFEEHTGLQDLYQVALFNDIQHKIVKQAIYIIPTNFLFGDSGSREIRKLVFEHFYVERGVVFEKSVFDKTGIHVGLFFLLRKEKPAHEPQEFEVLRVDAGGREVAKRYRVDVATNYRTGATLWEFLVQARAPFPLEPKYYLFLNEVEQNPGPHEVVLLDANCLERTGGYRRFTARVNSTLLRKLKSNPLYVRTVDTGRQDGKAGLYLLADLGVDGIVVTKAPYRTHPIHVFFEEPLEKEEVEALAEYFNLVLNYFRELEDSEFMTTYKYSESASYTRKYLGLKLVSSIIATFPVATLGDKRLFVQLKDLLRAGDVERVIAFTREVNQNSSFAIRRFASSRSKMTVQIPLFT